MYYNNLFAYPYLICSLYVLAMGYYVFGLNPRSGMNRSFLLQTVTAFIWQLGTFFVLLSNNESTAIFWARFTYLGATFISLATYSFVVNFLKLEDQKRWIKRGFFGMGLVFLPLLAGPLLIAETYKYSWGYWFKAGVLHPFFLIVFTFWTGLSFLNLYNGFKTEKDTWEKKKCKFVFYSYLISYIAIFDFFPDYGLPIYPCGFLPVTIFLTLIAFAVNYYDLMDLDFTRSGERPMGLR